MKLKGRKQSQNVVRATNTTGKSGRTLPSAVYSGKPAEKIGNKAGLANMKSPALSVNQALKSGAIDKALRKKGITKKGTK